MDIVCVDPRRVEDVWCIIGPAVDKAMEHTHAKVPLANVREAIAKGDMQAWVVGEGEYVFCVAVTQVLDHGAARTLNIPYLSGVEAECWLKPLYERLQMFAKHYNCDYVEMTARRGWGRLLRKCGVPYESKAVVYIARV